MKEISPKEILDRDSASNYIVTYYLPHIELLEELANYGSNLMIECYDSSAKTETDIVLIDHFLRQGVMLLDSVAEQLKSGCVNAAHLTSRALLENRALVNWIIDKDTDSRVSQFWVSFLRKEKLLAQRSIPGTAENKDYAAVYETLGKSDLDKYLLENEESARNTCAHIDKILSEPKFAKINAAFESARGNKMYEPLWYKAVDRNQSIRKIFEDVGMIAEYKMLYVYLSAYIHNSAMKSSFSFSGRMLDLQPIRSPKNIVFIISTTSTNILVPIQKLIS